MTKKLETIKKEFNDALRKGWEEFMRSEDKLLISDYSDELRNSGFFESKFRKKIPHPGHDTSAKLMGKYISSVLIKHSLQLDQFFPGDFSYSTESKGRNYEIRNFHMKLYKDGKMLANIMFSFPHKHSELDFPKAPYVTLTV